MSTTAIQASFYRELKESETCKKISISQEQYAWLSNYILNSFQKDTAGHVKYINANHNNTDALYEANGSYSIFIPAIPGPTMGSR